MHLASIVTKVGLSGCNLELLNRESAFERERPVDVLPSRPACVYVPLKEAVKSVFSVRKALITVKRTGLVGNSKIGGRIKFRSLDYHEKR